MRVEQDAAGLRIVLSKRNLLALLTKLDMPDSACTIQRDGVFVSSEPDDQHYGDRTPGEMHPFTEEVLARLRQH